MHSDVLVWVVGADSSLYCKSSDMHMQPIVSSGLSQIMMNRHRHPGGQCHCCYESLRMVSPPSGPHAALQRNIAGPFLGSGSWCGAAKGLQHSVW